ncbi:MAG TPA: response regulator [Chloroflexota bacterium]|nr:response regulator [Chloroflexota bacterium]
MAREPATILFVEDDPLICDVVCELLEMRGYAVECAEDAVEALLRLADREFDLIMIDVMLPGLDGRELCRRIRAHEGDVYVPIIMLTALSAEADRHHAFAAGADDYVIKPFDAANLLDRVAAWLHARERLRAAHKRLLAEQERLRALEQQTLRDRLAQDEAVLAMARTASHELNQPLTLLLGLLELWQADAYHGGELRLRLDLQAAANDLAARIELLGEVVRYETTEIAGYRILDLARARDPEPVAGA